MALRIPRLLPRIALIVFGALSLTAGLTYAAGSNVPSAPTPTTVPVAAPQPVIVPDVRGQAYVFAKGTLADAGFAWQVVGGVHGFPANTVVGESPAPGTALVQTGAPLITLTLRKAAGYAETGEPEDAAPFAASAVQPVDLGSESSLGPELPATTPVPTTPITTTPATTTRITTTTAAPAAQPKRTTQSRPPAFVVPGGKHEPLDEIPLPDRATKLAAWVDAHPKKTNANVRHWLYQNEWIVTGARLGWWHGAAALQTLVSVDTRVQQLWGIGADSRSVAAQALADVRAKSGH